MSDNSDNTVLADQCNAVRHAALRGISWLEANGKASLDKDPETIKKLYRCATQADKLNKAISRKSSVTVYGTSQAGKSWLMAGALMKDGRPLTVDFEGSTAVYVDHINPEGGKESTGLVTRFTMDKNPDAPAGFPVELRLLTELDIVKVLVDSYLNDLKHGEEDDDERLEEARRVADELDQLEASLPAEGDGVLDAEQVFDLESYCKRFSDNNPRLRLLRGAEVDYWRRAAQMAPRLDPAGRRKLMSILWNGLEVFDGTYERLQAASVQLGHPDTVFAGPGSLCELDANGQIVDRSERSLINVSALDGIGGGEGADDKVAVRTAAGAGAELPRSVLTALVAELVIPMQEKPSDLFDQMDMLDFPGAKTRKKLNLDTEGKIDNSLVSAKKCLLRGKVAYLFERYNADLELNAVMLCSGDEQNEVDEIRHLLNRWVADTHGLTAEQRTGHDNSLFVVFTKFDKSFETGAGKSDPFHNRITASLLDSFAMEGNWVDNWDEQGAFSNCFPYRNPEAARLEHVFSYASDDENDRDNYYRVTDIREDRKDYVEEKRQFFVNEELVQKHIRDPEAAWDAFMQQDGGWQRILENLTPLCNPELKRSQVNVRLGQTRDSIDTTLSVHHVGGNQDEALAKKRELARQLAQMLNGVATNHRFGAMLEHLQIGEQEIYDLHYAAKRMPAHGAQEEDGEPEEAKAAPVMEGLAGLFGDEPEAAAAEEEEPRHKVAATRQNDFAQRFGDMVAEFWSGRARELADDQDAVGYIRGDAGLLEKLAEELITGAERTGLHQRLVERFRIYEQRDREGDPSWKLVSTAVAATNDFVSYLGCGGAEAGDGVQLAVLGRDRHVFAPKPEVGMYPEIPEMEPSYDEDYYVDWIFSLAKLIEENVSYQFGLSGDLEENARLGEILTLLHS